MHTGYYSLHIILEEHSTHLSVIKTPNGAPFKFELLILLTHKNVTSEYFHTHIHSSACDHDIYIHLLPIELYFLRAGKGPVVKQVDLQQINYFDTSM